MNKILKLSFQNRKYLAFILLAGLCLSLAPSHFAGAEDAPDLAKCDWLTPWHCFAAVVHYLITFPIRLAAIQIAIPLAVIAVASGIGYTLITVLLGWIKTIALNVPVIPSEVGVVRAGFDITQSLANILLILALVFIGLATILRVKDYEAKKLLPILIIVALLVNFSPVLVGFVVDVTNIITNFFLNMGSFEYTVSIWQMIGNYFFQVFSILTQMGTVWDVVGYIVGIIILGIVIIAFFTYASWIYLMIVRILIVRIIALWILMILAPIAFLFYVLPVTRGLATKWWKTLVQWAILGVPIGFFLFLSFKILQDTVQINSFFHAANLSGNVESVKYGGYWDFSDMNAQLAESFGMMLAPLVSLAMLHIGYKLSRTYMPAFAQQMITKSEQALKKGVKIAGLAALTVATAGAGGVLAGGAAGALGKVGAGLSAVQTKLAGSKVVGGLFKALPIDKAAQPLLRHATSRIAEFQHKARKLEMPKGFKDWKPREQQEWIKNANLDDQELVQASAAVGKKRKFFDDQNLGAKMDKAASSMYGVVPGQKYTNDELKNVKANMDYMGEAEEVLKHSPNKVTNDLKIAMAIAGKTDPKEREEAFNKAAKEIKETRDFIESNLSANELDIEAAINLKIITREKAYDTNGKIVQSALNTAQQGLKNRSFDRDQFLNDTAAGANFVKEFKSSDYANITSTKNLATRTGIILGNPSNLQRIADEHGQDALEDVVNGPGGLNAATKDFDSIKRFRKISPRMYKGLHTNPALKYIEIEARNQMKDIHDQPTGNFDASERRMRVQEIADKDADLRKAYDGTLEMAKLRKKIKDTEDDLAKTNQAYANLREQEQQAQKAFIGAKKSNNQQRIKSTQANLTNIQTAIAKERSAVPKLADADASLQDVTQTTESVIQNNIEPEANKKMDWEEITRLMSPQGKKNK